MRAGSASAGSSRSSASLALSAVGRLRRIERFQRRRQVVGRRDLLQHIVGVEGELVFDVRADAAEVHAPGHRVAGIGQQRLGELQLGFRLRLRAADIELRHRVVLRIEAVGVDGAQIVHRVPGARRSARPAPPTAAGSCGPSDRARRLRRGRACARSCGRTACSRSSRAACCRRRPRLRRSERRQRRPDGRHGAARARRAAAGRARVRATGAGAATGRRRGRRRCGGLGTGLRACRTGRCPVRPAARRLGRDHGSALRPAWPARRAAFHGRRVQAALRSGAAAAARPSRQRAAEADAVRRRSSTMAWACCPACCSRARPVAAPERLHSGARRRRSSKPSGSAPAPCRQENRIAC